MADKNQEEEYLDRLLQNAMNSDEKIEQAISETENTVNEAIDDTEHIIEENNNDFLSEMAATDEKITVEEDNSDESVDGFADEFNIDNDLFEETHEDDEEPQNDLLANLENIVNASADEPEAVSNDADENNNEEEDFDPEELFRQLQNGGDFSLDDSDIGLSDSFDNTENVADNNAADEEISDEELEKILNGEVNFDADLYGGESATEADNGDEIFDESMLDNIDYSTMNMDENSLTDEDISAEPKTTKNKKVKVKKQKVKKSKADKKANKKKFSIKDFFVEEEDVPEVKVDQNQQMIDELYKDKDSLDEEKPFDEGKSKKAKKEKKPKKEKVKKEKKPKKVKPPKEKESPKNLISMGSVIKAVIFAGFICAIIIVGSKIFYYKHSVKAAKRAFEEGKYEVAYDYMSGLSVKEKDMDFYNKTRYIAAIIQGLRSYEACMYYNDIPNGIDSLVRAVGRKNSLQEEYDKYDINSVINIYYDKILTTLNKYDISEDRAMSYFSLIGTKEYNRILAKYKGTENDSDN